MDKQHIIEMLQTKKTYEKLSCRIKRQFPSCRYIGDITINDGEYEILKKILSKICENHLNSCEKYIADPLFAVALVQIGIRFYDGRFWPHVQHEINRELPGPAQKWIGRSFFYTLKKYNKYSVAENEMMNNILLHCFITEHYAADLFDFLFAYYQYDLERDLSRNNKDMRDYLMQSMSRGENTVRAYRIKRHTADAVSANERGCRIRVGKILRFMDNALFKGIYPNTSQNRVAQLFCKWAATSKKFDTAKKSVVGLTKGGVKRFRTPYIHFDGRTETFYLVFPQQYIHLGSDEEIPKLSWKVRFGDTGHIMEVKAESCVTGCKTQKTEDFSIPTEYLYEKITIELIKNDVKAVHKFFIHASCTRFFDDDWDLINYVDHLPEGQAFAFAKTGDLLLSDSDKTIFGCERMLDMDLYNLTLSKGDVLRLPDGKAVSVGKTLEEGIMQSYLLSDVYMMDNDLKVPLYSSVPSVYFQMDQSQEIGTLIQINNTRYRFDIEKCLKCSTQNKSDEKGYILKLSDYITDNGIHRIIIDIPGSRKIHDYTFAIIHGFSFEYEGAPYVFKEIGTIHFAGECEIYGNECSRRISDDTFLFDILPNVDYLPFTIKTKTGEFLISVHAPVFKWKFDDCDWEISKPEEIWHTEFPKFIYLKFPASSVILEMPPLMTDDSENEENEYSIAVGKNKEKDMFICDTRKISSWFGFEEILRPLSICFETYPAFKFADIVTRCFIADKNIKVIEDRKNMILHFKCNIIGFADCVADVYRNDELIAEKIPVYANGLKLNSPFISGKYRIDYFEIDDEDDFGFADYRKFASKVCIYTNEYDLSEKTVLIEKVMEHTEKASVFAPAVYTLTQKLLVTEIKLSSDEAGVYYGVLTISGQASVKVKFGFYNGGTKEAEFLFWNDEEEEYIEFLYDTQTHRLVKCEDPSLTAAQARLRYIPLFNDEYRFYVQVR